MENSKDCVVLDALKYERERELSELISTKAGVKGLVDSGILKVPRIFEFEANENHLDQASMDGIDSQVPIINLKDHEGKRRRTIMHEISQASKTWGIFHVFNHGVPLSVMSNVLESVCDFHEQPNGVKEEYYSHDSSRKVWYYATIHTTHRAALWKDTIACQFENTTTDFEALPVVCRKPMCDYVKHVVELKGKLCKLVSEALGLERNHLELMECIEARKLVGHYYPPCPEPSLTFGTAHHSDPYFLTILLQGDIDGLQVLHKNHWIHVPPMEGSLVVLMGDMLQIISNDLFRSAEHRVLANRKGPRLSTACFFYPKGRNKDRKYGPMKELLSNTNPALYKEVSQFEYLKHFSVHGSCCSTALPRLKLSVFPGTPM